MTKSRPPRVRRRMEVKYGPEETLYTGYSGNLSLSGLMLRAVRVFGKGTVLNLEIRIDDRVHRVRGAVQWARRGPIELLSTGRIGMGILFVDPPVGFLDAIRALDPASVRRTGS